MIFRTELPDNRWLKSQIESDFEECRGYYDMEAYGWPTVLINSTAREAAMNGIKGPLSIFFNRSGTSLVKIDSNRTTITNTSFVVANGGQTWDIDIPKQKQSDNVILSFSEVLTAQAGYYLRHKHTTLLDNPGELNNGQFNFNFGSVYRNDKFNRHFEKVHSALLLPAPYRQLKEEAIFNFIEFLFGLLSTERSRKDNLRYVKPSTRYEIILRLHKAVELMHAEYANNLSLDALAGAACMSKFHFLRMFKQAYGITPLRYIQKIRIERAVHLLRTTSFTVQAIAELVGMESGNSLTRIISSRTHFTPVCYRAKK